MVGSSIQVNRHAQRGARGQGQQGIPPAVVYASRARSPSPRPATGGVKTPAQIAGEARVFREQTTPALVRAARLEGFVCGLICGMLLSWLLR